MSLGSLVVKIGADISGIRRDAQRGADSLGGLEGATKKLGFALKALAVGAVANELKSMVSGAMDVIDAQAKLSRQLGGTVNGLQGLELAASEAGVSTGALTSAAEMLNRRLGEAARRGAGEAHDALTRLGLDARELGAMDLDVRMAAVADAVRQAGLSSQATADTLAQLGIRQGEFTRLLTDGGSALRAARETVDELGLSLSQVDAAKIEAANDAMGRVKLASTAITRRLAVELSPVLTAISNQFLDVASDSESIKDSVQTVVEYTIKGFGYVGDAVRGVHLVFKSVELVAWGLASTTAIAFRNALTAVSIFVDSGIERVNEVIEAVRTIADIDIKPIALTSDSAFMKGFVEVTEAAKATTADVYEQLRELATSEWPSSKAESFFRSIQDAAQDSAHEVVRTRREMLSFDSASGGSSEEEQKALDQYRERLGAQLNVLREHVMTKEELANAHHAARLDQLNAALDAQLVSQTEYARLAEGLEKRHMDELVDIRKRGMGRVHDISVSSMASQARQITGMLMNLTSSAARENKAMFEAHKAFAIADAVLSGASGVAHTLGAYPYPFNLGFAAAHAAMAAAQVGVISSKQFEGRSRTVAAPAASIPGGARAGGSAPTGGGASGEATGGQSQLVSINLQGDTFSREMVTSLIEGINEAIKDGGKTGGGMTEPLTHARIGYNSITTRGKVIASSARAGFPASAAANPLTYSYWSPSLPATWEVLLPKAEPCNYFGVAAHTLGSMRVMVAMEAWVDGAWKTMRVLTTTGYPWQFGESADGVPVFPAVGPEFTFSRQPLPTEPALVDPFPVGLRPFVDNRPLMVLVETAVSNRFRLRFLGKGTPVVGVIYIGKALEMARPLYGGHTPLNLNRSTVIRPNLSERGQFLGRSIIRCGARGSWTWNNLKAAWVRQKLDPFIEAARTRPFFILWRPATFPAEAGYCWTKGDQAPTNSGPADHMSFTLEAEGLGHE